jgi:hypothetical protein
VLPTPSGLSEAPTNTDVDTADGADTAQTGTQSSPTFEVKVNGETLRVTQDELLAGYSRQADYTRKSQDLANQRRELEQAKAIADALEHNPQQAIQTIAKFYGVTPPQPQSVAQEYASEDVDESIGVTHSGDDALRQEIAQLRQQMHAVATDAQTQKLSASMDALEQQFGEFDKAAVLRHMKTHNLPSVDVAYRDLYFTEAAEALAERRAREAAEQQVVAQKKADEGLVAQGGSIAAGSVQPIPDESSDIMAGSMADILRGALKESMSEHGVSRLDDPALLWGDS